MRNLVPLAVLALAFLVGCGSPDPKSSFEQMIPEYDASLRAWASDEVNLVESLEDALKVLWHRPIDAGSAKFLVFELGDMKYDVTETDSLVSPYTAYIEWPIEYMWEASSAPPRRREYSTIKMEFAFQNGGWQRGTTNASNLLHTMWDHHYPPPPIGPFKGPVTLAD